MTKMGSNAIHGGLSTFYSSQAFYGDNSGGIEDLRPQEVKFSTDTSVNIGGPLIKEKLFFFLAGGFTGLRTAVRSNPEYGYLKQAPLPRAP